MARIPARLLEHKVILFGRRSVPSSSGSTFLPPVTTEAITIDKVEEVVDQREGTAGATVVTNAHVLVQPEFWVPPGSRMVLWPDTPQQREVSIVACAIGRHSIAWESAQFWGV